MYPSQFIMIAVWLIMYYLCHRLKTKISHLLYSIHFKHGHAALRLLFHPLTKLEFNEEMFL